MQKVAEGFVLSLILFFPAPFALESASWHPHGQPSDDAREGCAPCFWESEPSVHFWGNDEFCDTEEEREQNDDCNEKAGLHASHNNGSGPCPGTSCDEETLATLIETRILHRGPERLDAATLAFIVGRGVAELDRDRSVLQVIGCRDDVLAQLWLRPLELASLDRVMASPQQTEPARPQ